MSFTRKQDHVHHITIWWISQPRELQESDLLLLRWPRPLPTIIPDGPNKWLGQSSRVAQDHYLTPTCPPITASSEAIGDHHGSEEANDLIGGDGPCNSGEYTHQDSNNPVDSQGKPDELKNCPTVRPQSAPQVPPDAVELLAVWSLLTADQKAELLRTAKKMRGRLLLERIGGD